MLLMTRLTAYRALLFCLVAAAGAAAGPAMADSVVTTWDNALLQAIRDTKPGPPMVARDLAIVHTCIYDAWAAHDPVAVGTRFGGFLRRPADERTDANKAQAISFAAYRALVDLFPQPQEVAIFDAQMAALGYDPNDTSEDASTPTGIGNLCAAAVIAFRHGDGSNQLGDLHPGAYTDYTGYQPVNTPDQIIDPNRWQPLRVSNGHGGFVVQTYIGPFWGLVTPFALRSSSQFQPPPPARYPSAHYRQQAIQILNYSANLTDRQKMIAEYFADGPSSELPPGHWMLFTQFVSHRDGYGIDQDAKVYFAVSNATMDAGIACWDCKRVFDSVRPITAIHFLFKGKTIRAYAGPGRGTQFIKGEDWSTYGQASTVVTPAFPEYNSGHSTFSAASAEVLKRFTGSDRFGASVTLPPGSSRTEPGITPKLPVTLSWPTFSDAANMAGLSRRYGGIHFEDGDLQGRMLGRKVGRVVWQKAQEFFNGTAAPDPPPPAWSGGG